MLCKVRTTSGVMCHTKVMSKFMCHCRCAISHQVVGGTTHVDGTCFGPRALVSSLVKQKKWRVMAPSKRARFGISQNSFGGKRIDKCHAHGRKVFLIGTSSICFLWGHKFRFELSGLAGEIPTCLNVTPRTRRTKRHSPQ